MPARLPRLPPAAAALALALLLLAGCGTPAPKSEILGATGIVFTARPVGHVEAANVVWDAELANQDNATSAPAQLHVSVRSSRTGMPSDQTVDVAPLPPHGTRSLQVRTPYDGTGDYSGVAEVLIGQTVVERAYVFFEQCSLGPLAAAC